MASPTKASSAAKPVARQDGHPAWAVVAAYYRLAKPGIVYGNLLTVVSGAWFAGSLLPGGGPLPVRHWSQIVAVAAGSGLVIAGGCVLNNIIDRRLDTRMARTRQRALVTGLISPGQAVLYGSLLSALGLLVLALWTNSLTVYVGLTGLYIYLVAYGLGKRYSPAGTLIGSLAGAIPILAGYTAVSGRLDWPAAFVFGLVAIWQLPHFYAIALYRLADYTAAGLPVLPAVKGSALTRRHIQAWVIAFGALCLAGSLAGLTGLVFAVAMSLMTAYWLAGGLSGRADTDAAWGRRMFGRSLQSLLLMSLLLAANSLLP